MQKLPSGASRGHSTPTNGTGGRAITYRINVNVPNIYCYVDVNRIEVAAEPTNPHAPDGETEVTVRFPWRDNISGLAISSLYLRDPQGGTHPYYVYPSDRDLLYPEKDPTEWQWMEEVVILPVGSVPGVWGLAEITAQDRAGNFESFNFVEIVHFDVEGG